jgi:hypothetical protein
MINTSLRLYTPVLLGQQHVPGWDLTQMAQGWKRSIRRQGGYWSGSFDLLGTKAEHLQWFNNYMGFHLEERTGGQITWEGMLYEMELTVGGITRRRSLDNMFNYVTATYIDTDNNVQTSSPFTDNLSIERYGRREQLLTLDGYHQPAAEAYAESYKNEYAYPTARTINILGSGRSDAASKLTITACGYIFTANWRYETAGDGTDDDVSTYIGDIAGTDCEYLLPGKFESNTLQVRKESNTPIRAFDQIMAQVDLGDADLNRYRFYVDQGRRAYYRKIDTNPVYYLRGGELYTTPGGLASVNPWQIQPGVVRDYTYVTTRAESLAWLQDPRDFYLDEVEVGPAGLVLKTEYFDDTSILSNQLHYQQQLEEEKRREAEQAKREKKKKKK